MKGNLFQLLSLESNSEPADKNRIWKGTCPICGRFQDSLAVCRECAEDGWDLRIPSLEMASNGV